MPTFDGGHCFLTALLPIKTEEIVDDAGMRSSPVHMVRDALAILPTSHQSPVTASLPVISPFAKDKKTHFARLAVIDNVIFGGRLATNALTDRSDRTVAQAVDQLPCPYLMVVIDFDAPEGTVVELRRYLSDMWANMRAELKPVFDHCFGYADKATTPDGFADYIIGCQIETTMPFNDYWTGSPPFKALSISVLAVIGLAVAAVTGRVAYGAFDAAPALRGWPQSITIFLLALAAGAYAAYWLVMRHGAKPFPTAPNSDLRSVLKALYLQRELIRFAIKMQGRGNSELYKEFGSFLEKHRVNDLAGPTQDAGTIRF
ncbi:MAG TPA: hypothetical protein VK479_14785 [Micropepsaceae bacterium]|nr:hypothetical protein [Micropepsaceae bacterium]